MPRYDFSREDALRLAEAHRILENPSLAIRLANTVGMPIERLMSKLPGPVSHAVTSAASAAIERALEAAVSTIDSGRAAKPANAFHKLV